MVMVLVATGAVGMGEDDLKVAQVLQERERREKVVIGSSKCE
jgi:hypothetical protein